jgi:hypothetical protein
MAGSLKEKRVEDKAKSLKEKKEIRRWLRV